MALPGEIRHQLLLIACLFIASCHRGEQQVVKEDSLQEHMINANKIMVKNESAEIEEFISRHSWKMTSTGTGLRYEIYRHGNGKKADVKNRVTICYTAYLLDGTLCYTVDEKNPLTITLGHGEQIRGLEEGIMQMNEGDHARLVIPAHLGFGIAGDKNKIPRNSALYYDVYLLKITGAQ